LQEFDLEIRDKAGRKNVVADHLSRLPSDTIESSPPITEHFPDDHLLTISIDLPWYADIVNYLVTHQFLPDWDENRKS
jgi:hypothetical protein